ncbi:hypothetical protein BASA81_006310 [Batrachochytrium salamandrivorans]|nr:hypothetical protein BASA81_006310 [Batrachochytrium salamandrivorans]
MCICFFQVGGPRAKYPLVFCGNRDEFLSRESIVLHEWRGGSGGKHRRSFGGLDAVRGGTWLACSSNPGLGTFRFCVVHNIRRKHLEVDQTKQSRGDLPKDFVMGKLGAKEYAEQANRNGSKYFGFTLLLADESGVYFTSNANNRVLRLREGTYSISNALLDTPWPKVVYGKELFRNVLEDEEEDEDVLAHQLVMGVLKDATLFPHPLPGVLDSGVEIFLSSINVSPFQWNQTNGWGLYATRMHTALLVRRDLSLKVIEHSLDTKSSVQDWTGKWTVTQFDTATVQPSSRL